MDYLEIVLIGYFNENNRVHLENYFFREFKKAEKEHYSVDEFFTGCLTVVQGFEWDLFDQMHKRKHELYFMLNGAKNRTLQIEGSNNSKNYKEKCLDTIEYCRKELDTLSQNNFKVQMASFTGGRIVYNMAHNEVLFIKKTIKETLESVTKKSLTDPIVKQPRQDLDEINKITDEEIEKKWKELRIKERERFKNLPFKEWLDYINNASKEQYGNKNIDSDIKKEVLAPLGNTEHAIGTDSTKNNNNSNIKSPLEKESNFEVYKAIYFELLGIFLKNNPDAIEYDFLEKEIKRNYWTIYFYENSEAILMGAIENVNASQIPNESEYYSANKIDAFLKEKKEKLISTNKQAVEHNPQTTIITKTQEDPILKQVETIESSSNKLFDTIDSLQETIIKQKDSPAKISWLETYYNTLKAVVALYERINDVLIKERNNYIFDIHLKEAKKKALKGLTKVINALPKSKEISDLIAKKIYEIKNEELIREIEGNLPTEWQNILKKYLLNHLEYHERAKNVHLQGGQNTVSLGQEDYALLSALENKAITDYISNPTRKQIEHCNKYLQKLFRLEINPEWSREIALNKLKRYDKVIPHIISESKKNEAQIERDEVEKKINETHFD